MAALDTTTEALLRSAVDAAFAVQVSLHFAARCDAIVQERRGQGDAVLIALEVREEFYARYGITPTVNQQTNKGES